MKAESKRSWIQFCLIVSLPVSLLFELQCEQEVRVVPGGLDSTGGSFCYRFITFYGTNFKSKPTCVWLCSLKVAFSILQVMWCLWFHDSLQTREKHIGVLFMRGERRSQKSQLPFPRPDLWPQTEKKKKEQDSRFPQKPKATPQPTQVSMRAEATVDQFMSR